MIDERSAVAVDGIFPQSIPDAAPGTRRRWRRLQVPAVMVLLAGAGLLWWATRGERGAAAAERTIAQLHARLSSRLAAQAAVPLSLSPDRRVAVMGRRLDVGYQLELVGLPDRKVLSRALLETPGELAWRPAGDVLAFTAPAAGKSALYLWDAAQGSPRVVDTWAGVEPAAQLAWDAAGEQLAFVRPEGDPSARRLVRLVTRDGRAPRTLVVTTDVRSLAWMTPAPTARLAVVAPPLCRDGIAVLGVPGRAAAAGRSSAGGEGPGAPVRCLTLGEGQEPRHLAHDARTGRLLVSTRPRGAPFFGLSELDPNTGSLRALAAPDGDVAWPAYTARGYLYQVERGGQSMLQLGPGGRGFAALAEGRIRLLGLSPDGATVVVRHASLGKTAELLELSLDSGQTRPLLAGAPSGAAPAVRPEVVVIDHPHAGVELRDFLWRSPRPAEHRKLVVEVALQGEPPDPTFRLPRDLLVQEGFDVLLAVYRGVTGFGAKFAETSDPLIQADDVGLSLRYAVEQLGYRPGDIVVLAASRAATLVAIAASSVPDHLRQMVLLDPIPTTCETQRPTVAGRRVTLIHGEGGLRSLGETEFLATTWLGAGALEPPAGRVRVLGNASLRRVSPAAVSAITEEIARLLLLPST